jgi:hypothetical protein
LASPSDQQELFHSAARGKCVISRSFQAGDPLDSAANLTETVSGGGWDSRSSNKCHLVESKMDTRKDEETL